jgi:uncharacterized C2H2 Zn-finger protein
MIRRITFEQEKFQGIKNLKCPTCGKRVRRQRIFSQTINPWNKRPDGIVKDWRDIRKELIAEADKWKQIPETCNKCK